MWLQPDISHWQGHHTREDMAQAATVASSILLKATQGDGFVDPEFESNAKAANAVNLPWGAYHFVDTLDEGGGAAQAEHFWRVVNRVPGCQFFCIDWERAGRALVLALADRLQDLTEGAVMGDYIGSHARANGGQLSAMDFHMVPQYGPAELDPRYATDPLSAWQYCADIETEILTAEGWKTYQEVSTEDEVLTLDVESGLAEWQQSSAINVFPYSGPMVFMEGRAHSSLTTPDHRWPTSNGQLVQAKDLSDRDRLVLAAPCAVPPESKYSDAFVEAVAWYWTEGWPTNEVSAGLYISQSEGSNPEACARIRACLTALLGPPVQRNRSAVPSWSEGGTDDCRKFRLSKAAAESFHDVAPNRIVSPDFILSLTRAQLRLFVETSIEADGSHIGTSNTSIYQARPEMLDGIELACILLGLPVSRRKRTGVNSGERLSLLRRAYVRPVADGRGGTTTDGLTSREVRPYDGVVWCPTTPNRTWFARRAGTMYFTGNTNGEVNGTDWPSGVPGIGKCDMSAVYRPADFGFGDDMAIEDADVQRIAKATVAALRKSELRADGLLVEQAWRDANVTRTAVAAMAADVANWDDNVLAGLKAALVEALGEMEIGDLSADEVAETVAQKFAERLSA